MDLNFNFNYTSEQADKGASRVRFNALVIQTTNIMDLGKMLNYAQRYNLHTIPAEECECPAMSYDRKVIAIDKFRMQSHSHSTGNSVRVYIVGAGQPYLILRGTYWTSPGYDWNEFHHEHGEWDEAFNNAKKILKEAIEEHKKKRAEAKRKAEKEKEKQKKQKKKSV